MADLYMQPTARRRKPGDAGAPDANELDAQVTKQFSSNPNPPPPQAPEPTPSAYDLGQSTRQAISSGATAAGGALVGALRANAQPIVNIAAPIASFARGLVGALPNDTLSPISSAGAATLPAQPAAAASAPPPQRTQLPPLTVSAPNTATPAPNGAGDAGQRVPIGRTFGTRSPDGSVAFSNIPGALGYDPGYNRAGDNANVISASNFANPAPGVAASAATGGAVTPAAGGGSFTLPGALPGTGGGNGVYNPQADVAANARQAQSDINSVVSHDWRSPLGITARNLSLDLATTSPGGRYGARGPSPYEQAINELVGGIRAGQQSNDAAALNRAKEETDTQRALIGEQGQESRERLRLAGELQKPNYQVDADGNLVNVSGTGAQTVTRGGAPLAVQGKINASEEKMIYSEAHKNALANGLDADAAAEAGQQAVLGYRKLGTRGSAEAAPTASSVGPPKEAAAFLKQNPTMRDQFDLKYGKGAAAKILGNG